MWGASPVHLTKVFRWSLLVVGGHRSSPPHHSLQVLLLLNSTIYDQHMANVFLTIIFTSGVRVRRNECYLPS